MKAITTSVSADMDQTETRPGGEVDFDIHGFAGIRLVDASETDATAVRRQLGALERTLTREPDIVVRFVRRLRPTSTIRYLGMQDTESTNDGLLVVGGHRRREGSAMIPFAQIGATCEIICETGSPSVPLLTPIVNITALSKGVIPVHASAFSYRGTGVLVSGWARGGKTTTLLAFMADGAQYIGDDWVYLTGDGRRAYGFAEPIALAHRHLEDLPDFRAALGRRGRARLRSASLVRLAGGLSSQRFERFTRRAEARLSTHVDPRRLFGEQACTLEGDPRKVFLVVSHEANTVAVEPIEVDKLARILAFSSRHERLRFLSDYLKFRFAFPDGTNQLIDRIDDLELEALQRGLKDKDAYVVYHPFPAPVRVIHDAMLPFL